MPTGHVQNQIHHFIATNPPSSWILLGSQVTSAGQGRNTGMMPDVAHYLACSICLSVLLEAPKPSCPSSHNHQVHRTSSLPLRDSFLFLSRSLSLLPLSIRPAFFLHSYSPKKQQWSRPFPAQNYFLAF